MGIKKIICFANESCIIYKKPENGMIIKEKILVGIDDPKMFYVGRDNNNNEKFRISFDVPHIMEME